MVVIVFFKNEIGWQKSVYLLASRNVMLSKR